MTYAWFTHRKKTKGITNGSGSAGTVYIPLLLIVLNACGSTSEEFDASGTFETEETVISSEVSGLIKQLDIHEGQVLQAGEMIGYVDSTQLVLKKKQLQAQVNAVLSKRPDIATQIASLQEQLKAAETEQARIRNMLKSGAATPQQQDDIDAQVNVLKSRIEAQYSSLDISTQSLNKETTALHAQIEQLNDQIAKCRIVSPVKGTVLTKYTEPYEVISPGKPFFKMADVSELILRAYVTGSQFSALKLGQQVTVLVDDGPDTYREYEGVLEWISDEAEFTPKTIQTKEERANLVYAVKIRVKNDSRLKIGMYGEVRF